MDVRMLAALGIAGGALIAAVALGILAVKRGAKLKQSEIALQRYSPIIDLERHASELRDALARATAERDEFIASDQKRRSDLNVQYEEAIGTYKRLRAEISSLEESLEDISYGLYKPHYTFETSDEYKRALDLVYANKKSMIRAGTAASCATEWSVGGSKSEGARMTKKNIKVMLRAFNGEVDAAVAKVAWNNVTRMEERIRKSFEAINEMGTSNLITISSAYLDQALNELRLTHEYARKKHEEREEQRRIAELMREEDKARKEAERAQQDAATEEARFEKALARARAEVEQARGSELEEVNAKVADLERKLAEAHEKMERAKSLAELTRSGHVYVISNVGSFGERTFKIGMTRRLDPMDRIAELGDASVPFPFDVHALIYSEDAPTLENAFHREFGERRVNLVNQRKEYFEVSLDEIETFARKQNVSIQFTKLAEAREYRETLAIRRSRSNGTAADGEAPHDERDAFPQQLLAG